MEILIKVTMNGAGLRGCSLLTPQEVVAHRQLPRSWVQLDAPTRHQAAREVALHKSSILCTPIGEYEVFVEEVAPKDVSKTDYLKLHALYAQIERNLERGECSNVEAIAGRGLRELIARCPWTIDAAHGVVPVLGLAA